MNKIRFDLELPRPMGFLDVNGGQQRYAIDLHAPDFSKCDLLTEQEKTDCAVALTAKLDGQQIDAHPGPEFPGPTPLQEWEQKAAQLDAKLMASSSRAIEDIATLGTISVERKAKLAPIIVEREAHRAARPK